MGARKKKSRKRSGHIGVWSILVIALVLIGTVSFRCMDLYAKNREYEKMEASLLEELEEETNRSEEIAAYEKTVGSDEYIEKLAREKLGLVYGNEIVFEEK